MIPLLVAGAVSVASDVVDAWKAHAQNTATAQAAKNADFQQQLQKATTQLVATAQQQRAAAIPKQLDAVTRQILQAPDVQSMARTSPTGNLNLEFNSNGDLFVTKPGGGVRQLAISGEVRQELQQLNGEMHAETQGAAKASSLMGVQVNGFIGTSNLPVHLAISAV